MRYSNGILFQSWLESDKELEDTIKKFKTLKGTGNIFQHLSVIYSINSGVLIMPLKEEIV